MEFIKLNGVATNNLKSIDVRIPLGRLTVVTGVSGSGKSSLVFDTLYGEAYRRYVESLSSFARQYLKALPKPEIDSIENLPPAIAVKQAKSSGTSRSTVGTMTEISDLLRVLFTYLSEVYCPDCDLPVRSETPESVVRDLFRSAHGQDVTVSASLRKRDHIKTNELKSQLESQGFTRVEIAGKIQRLSSVKAADLKQAMVVVDRVRCDEDQRIRLTEAVGMALKLGRGEVFVRSGDLQWRFCEDLSCNSCERSFSKPALSLFSFNHPSGACPHCQGFGMEGAIDWEKAIPNQESSLADEGVLPWNFGSHVDMYRQAAVSGKKIGLNPKKSFSSYSPEEWHWLKFGDGKSFDGIKGYFDWLETKRHKTHYRIHAARFRKYVICHICKGERLNPDALACLIRDANFARVSRLSILQFADWLEATGSHFMERANESRLSEGVMGLSEAFSELRARTSYLKRVGLSYLSIDRQTRTLSGGEQQRINMARCLGSALTETMYCLDEPTAGLHARDSQNLLEVLKELRDQGNTVVVVEHEHRVISGADHVIEIGPDAGHLGGRLVFAGEQNDKSESPLQISDSKLSDKHSFISLRGARTHNLKNIDVKIPVAKLSVVCGVSGSGKTSLIQHTLYPMLAKELGSPLDGYVGEFLADGIGPKDVIRKHEQIVHVSQSSLGRSSRSNIATYLGIYDGIRKVLSQTPRAQQLGLTPGHFSFNTAGGRCEHCRGLGTVVEDLSFLGEMEVLCSVCQGRRFSDAVLSVDYRGKNLSQILQMTVAELRELFFDAKNLASILRSVMDMGLGYVTVGQTTSSFSGGEAQRLKLLRLLTRTDTTRPSILIFDEPTTGLSDRDVNKLMLQFRGLCDEGHTVIVVEHHLQVIAGADWIIEIGPEASDLGGQLVFAGVPRDLLASKNSPTAKFLLERSSQ
jgi:excinuclease ABC subunit A